MAASEGGAWFWMATAALERLEIALLLEDADRMGRAVELLEEAAAAQGVAPPIRRRGPGCGHLWRRARSCAAGDAAGVRRAVERLLGLDQEAVGWIRRDRAVAELDAIASALQRDPDPLLALARIAPGCEGTVRGGETLLRHGWSVEGEARVREGLTDVCPQFGYPRFLRAVARGRLRELAERAGRLDEAAEHARARARLWPDESTSGADEP